MKERNRLIKWIKKNRKKLIAAGIGVGTLVLLILGIRNKDAIKTLWDSLRGTSGHSSTEATEAVVKVVSEISQKSIQESISTAASTSKSIPFEVSRHVRTLPEGWHASPEKVAKALENHIILKEGQTWVNSYVKGDTAA